MKAYRVLVVATVMLLVPFYVAVMLFVAATEAGASLLRKVARR